MEEPQALSFEQQLELFEKRGIRIQPANIEKIEHINYYRLKEFASPLSKTTKDKNGNVRLEYPDLTFDEILTRYYQDKNLRMYLLHAIEKIEISLKTRISHILGTRYGAFGYLNFFVWSNKQKNSPFEIEKQQFRIKNNLLKTIKKSQLRELRNQRNLNKDGFPSVWLAIDLLTFGDIVTLVELMSETNIRNLANVYGCTKDELLSWIRCLNFVRNICAHNSNLVDVQLTTKPKLRKEWAKYLYFVDFNKGQKRRPTNRLAVIILIVLTLVKCINSKYNFKSINNSLMALSKGDDKRSNLIGFSSVYSIKELFHN